MIKLGDLYSGFSRIDLDTRGGYARVAQARTHGQEGYPENCAFKLMRHEIDYQKGLERFEAELKILAEITKDKNAPPAITWIYDSGFAPVELSQNFEKNETPNPDLRIYSTGTNIKKFLERKSSLEEKEPGRWLPFLVVELAPYDDSLLRQIHHQPKEDALGLYRLPVGEVIAMAVQLIDVVEYLHNKHRRAYMDWKPEHLFWNGMNKQVKLIDWNVTVPLDEQPGEQQNIRDDTRLFCGAVLYISLTFIDPDDPTKPIGPRPTEEFQNPIPEIRRRYWTDNPNFYQRNPMLDGEIKQIIAKGLDPKQGFAMPGELKEALLNYARHALGISEAELMPGSPPVSQYFKTLAEVHTARHQFLQAQQSLIHVVEAKGANPEFTWLFESIKQALLNFPGS